MRELRMAAVIALLAMLTVVPRAGAATTTYSTAQLDQLVSPIALYPDSLLTQILMASTYPVEIVDAQRWLTANPNLSSTQLQQELAKKNWDPSVSSLCQFPDVLSRMSQNLDWTEALGEAFLGQKTDVLNAVQTMRQKAQAAGNLQTGTQQTVSQSQGSIVIDPANAQTVYVPLYDPATVYGSSWSYPTWYWPNMMVAPAGWVAGTALAFGTGIAVGSAMFGGVNWYNHGVYVNHNYWSYPGYHTGALNSAYVRNGNVTVRNGNTYVNNFNVNRTNVNNANFNKTMNRTNVNWQYDNTHRQNANFQNQSLQSRYNTSTVNANRGYVNRSTTTESMPGSRSIPYTAPKNTGFGNYNNANATNRDAIRGAGSTGRAGANWGNVQRSAPTRSMGGWNGSRGGFGGARGGGFRGGRR